MARQVPIETLTSQQRENLWRLFELGAELKRRVIERRASGVVPVPRRS